MRGGASRREMETTCMWRQLERLCLPLLTQSPFTSTHQPLGRTMKMMDESTYWEGRAPPSKVLGPFLAKIPSGILGPASLVCLIVVSLVFNQWCRGERGKGGGNAEKRKSGTGDEKKISVQNIN
jgi:hypothetical protein